MKKIVILLLTSLVGIFSFFGNTQIKVEAANYTQYYTSCVSSALMKQYVSSATRWIVQDWVATQASSLTCKGGARTAITYINHGSYAYVSSSYKY